MHTFTLFADPGHAWAKVPTSWLHDLNIANRITPYSYQHGVHVYLEEDMDLETFVRAYREQYDVSPQFVTKYSDRSSRIRSYDSYRI